MSDYRRVLSYFYGQPWALERAKWDEIESILLARAVGERLSDDEVRARIGQGQRPPLALWDVEAEAFMEADTIGTPQNRQVVAVVGIYGVITHRAGMFTQTSGLAAAEDIGRRVRAAASDAAVRSIVLDVDSPGGSVYGIQEAAAEIRAARALKPVRGVANARAGSAAYWLLAQADDVGVTPSGEVGSIGVIVEHADTSALNEKLGVKITTITHGKNKALGSPNEPLSDEARADLERRVAAYGRAFEEDVAKGRGVAAAKVRKDFGQGLVFGAPEAVERGLADRVATLEQMIQRAAGRGKAADATPVAAVAPEVSAEALAKLRGMQA